MTKIRKALSNRRWPPFRPRERHGYLEARRWCAHMVRKDRADPDDFENAHFDFEPVLWEGDETVIFWTGRGTGRRERVRLTRDEFSRAVRRVEEGFRAG